MITINIICLGKLKESYLKDACNEYIKRLKLFCKLNMVEINECRLADNPKSLNIRQAIQSEGEAIISKIQPGSFTICMCIEGIGLDSNQFADKIEQVALQGKNIINIIIGSSWGLSDNVKEICDIKLSMSGMTFPHQLFRVMVLEQVYRAFCILNNNKYHK